MSWIPEIPSLDIPFLIGTCIRSCRGVYHSPFFSIPLLSPFAAPTLNEQRQPPQGPRRRPSALPPVPPPVVGGEWLFDNQFVPGTDCAEDPWLDFEAEPQASRLAQTAFFAPSHVLDSVEPTDAHVFKEESCPEPQVQQSRCFIVDLVQTSRRHPRVSARSEDLPPLQDRRSCQLCVCTRTFCDRCIEKCVAISLWSSRKSDIRAFPKARSQRLPATMSALSRALYLREVLASAAWRRRRPPRPAQPVASLKRQHSEEDEEYVSKEDLATAALMHTEVRREALRKGLGF